MWPVTNEHTVMFATKPITLKKLHELLQILDNIKFLDIIILEQKPCTKTRSSSPNDFMFRLTNISLALLCHGKPINRLKLLLYATFNFVDTVFDFLYNQTTWVHNIN